MSSILDAIVERVRAELPARIEAYDGTPAPEPSTLDFAGALSTDGLSVIAEVKRRSPSRGAIDLGLEPTLQARRYIDGGAAAISVLTERHHFAGSPEDLMAVASESAVPVLRKDFIVHPVQVWEARAWGAAAVLLIAAVLTDAELASLREEAQMLGMAALVEAHDEEEVHRALSAGATVVGINNRDLTTFDVDIATAVRLRPHIPEGVVAVAESGIWTGEDARRMRDAGFDAVLVGEALVRAGDPAALLAEMSS